MHASPLRVCTPSAPWLEEVGAASMALHSSQANP